MFISCNTTFWILLGIVCALTVLYFTANKEGFALLDTKKIAGPAKLSNGTYLIKNKQGQVLASTAFTPIMCNDWIFQTPQPIDQSAWNLQKVSGGVYKLNKLSSKSQECLYAHESGELRSYLSTFCNTNLCGQDQMVYGDELDPYSIRTYFKINNGPDNTYLIQSLKNNMYIKFTNNKVEFVPQPEEECLFVFEKQ
jgi:hypothetical protein